MRVAKTFLLGVVAAAAVLQARAAAACGGCFAGPSEVTQIVGEKMLLSLSTQQTTLYDQITYSGDPSSFAWVLPIKGVATVGLSSDALFQNLGTDTQVTISAPQLNCPPPPSCGYGAGGSATFTGSSSSGGSPGDVNVISQAVVGPYETVQLQSTDPLALRNWLADHGYAVPAADGPVIDAYTAEGFNFLALKLVPGQGINAMRPVRVTTQGASTALPLRMVAVGTGAITPITLWILGEGRYDTVEQPSFQIDPSDLVWDWNTQSSNYSALKQAGFTKLNNAGWLVEAAEPFSMYELQNQLQNLVDYDPLNSGYADAMGQNAAQNLADDMATLFAGISPSSSWVTRFEGQLSHDALSVDLHVTAAASQVPLSRYYTPSKTTGAAPACPSYPPCEGNGGYGAGSSSGQGSGWGYWGNGGSPAAGSGSCAMTSEDTGGAFATSAALLLAMAIGRRRRARI